MTHPHVVQAQVARMADLAWAAGVLDGSAQWVAVPRKVKNGTTYTMRVRVRKATAFEPLLNRLKDVLGGNVGRHHMRCEWQVSGAQACLDLLLDIGPYLHMKGREAQAHSLLCRHIVDHKPTGLDRTLPAAVLSARSRLAGKAQMDGVILSPKREPPDPPRVSPDADDVTDIPF